MGNWNWTPGSALWEIAHGEPGPRTADAAEFLRHLIDVDPLAAQHVARQLLDQVAPRLRGR